MIPFPILLPVTAIEITEDTHQVCKEFDIPDDARELLDEYLAFILSDERVEREKNILDDFISMSDELKSELQFFNFQPLFQDLTKRDIKAKLIKARTIYMKGGGVLMPFIDLMNHDSDVGLNYHIDDTSVFIRGNASENGELFAKYNIMNDAFSYLSTYLFLPQSENITSMDMTIDIDSKTKLSIKRDHRNIIIDADALVHRDYCISQNTISIPFLWIGSHKKPRNPFWSFKRLWEDHIDREDTQRVYSIIKSLNIQKLINIIRLCEHSTKQTEAISMIKESAMQHISIIAESYEDLLDYPTSRVTRG